MGSDGRANPEAGLQAIADLDRTVHSPARLMILAVLYVSEEADFSFLLGRSGLTRGNLSSHMARLEEEGYVTVRKEFVARRPLTVYRITRQGRRAFSAYRQQMMGALASLPEE